MTPTPLSTAPAQPADLLPGDSSPSSTMTETSSKHPHALALLTILLSTALLVFLVLMVAVWISLCYRRQYAARYAALLQDHELLRDLEAGSRGGAAQAPQAVDEFDVAPLPLYEVRDSGVLKMSAAGVLLLLRTRVFRVMSKLCVGEDG